MVDKECVHLVARLPLVHLELALGKVPVMEHGVGVPLPVLVDLPLDVAQILVALLVIEDCVLGRRGLLEIAVCLLDGPVLARGHIPVQTVLRILEIALETLGVHLLERLGRFNVLEQLRRVNDLVKGRHL